MKARHSIHERHPRSPLRHCTLCCHGEAIILHPEDGDDHRTFLTKKIWHPLRNREVYALQRKPGGDACIYLGAMGGCTIHERRPAICRSFDCRKFAQKFTRSQVKKLDAVGAGELKVWERGHALRDTLGEE